MTNVAKKIVNTLAAIGLGLAITNVNPVKAAQLTIRADSNIFGAGKTSAPGPAGGSGGQLPPMFDFAVAAGQVLTFSSISGIINYSWANPGTSTNGMEMGVLCRLVQISRLMAEFLGYRTTRLVF
jgi:hypothetical protein